MGKSKMSSKIFKYEVKDTNNKKSEIILCILGLHTQLRFAVEQQLERLRALDIKSVCWWTRVLWEWVLIEYICEYATVTKQEPNHTTSITSIRVAISELENLITVESNPTFKDLSRFSGSELETLRNQLLNLINQFNNYYPHVGVLHCPPSTCKSL